MSEYLLEEVLIEIFLKLPAKSIIQCKSVLPPHVELFKLSTGVWQDITPISPSCLFVPKISGFYMNGACHWVASKRKGGESQNMIVLFDMHEEKFWDMMVPGSLVAKPLLLLGEDFIIFVSDESLCLAGSSFGNDGTIDIWMMKEYGDPESWVKQFTISLSHISFNIDVVDEFFSMLHGDRQRQVAHFLAKPIAPRKNGEILWRADNGLLVSYDPEAEKIKNLGIHNANDLSSLCKEAKGGGNFIKETLKEVCVLYLPCTSVD